MNEVSKKSVNGGSQISGGFIFDQMDRFAYHYLKRKYKIKNYLFTKSVIVEYEKQVCDWNSMRIFVVFCEKILGSNDYRIRLELFEPETDTTYAYADFIFVEKDHAYCDTKGE